MKALIWILRLAIVGLGLSFGYLIGEFFMHWDEPLSIKQWFMIMWKGFAAFIVCALIMMGLTSTID